MRRLLASTDMFWGESNTLTSSVLCLDQTVAAQAERFNHLVKRIRALLAEVDGHLNARNNARKGDQLAPSATAPSAADENLSSTLTALRAEVTALRAELGEKCMIHTLPPSYQA